MDTYTTVKSNGITIPFAPAYFKEMQPADYSDPGNLAAQLDRDGYILLRGFLDKAEVLGMRDRYLQLFSDVIFKEGSERSAGLFSGVFQYKPNEHGHPDHPASAFVKTQVFDEFTAQRKLFELTEHIFGTKTKILIRRPLRHFYRGTSVATKAHADFTYLDKGTRNLVSVWVPWGDVALNGGAIIYLEGTHKTGHEEFRKHFNSDDPSKTDTRPITADLKSIAEISGRKWLYTNFEAGDIVVHSPFIIHATTDCDTDAMRISTDLRFAPVDDSIDPRWKADWRGDDGY